MALLLVSAGAILPGCDKLGLSDRSPTGPTGPPTAGTTIRYAAVGASDVIGYGSSKPCILWEDCNGMGYVWVAARQLRSNGFTVAVTSLGIPTATISRAFQDLANQNGHDTAGNLVEQEMPFVPKDATMVTVFTGPNDVNAITAALGRGAGASNPAAYIDDKVAVFGADFRTLLDGIRSRTPAARIVVLNVPNLAALPFMAGASLQQKQAAQRAAVRMTTTVVNTLAGVVVIDLLCDPRFYQASVYSSDGFHPNDAGYTLMGDEVATAIRSTSYPAPKSSCSQMSLY